MAQSRFLTRDTEIPRGRKKLDRVIQVIDDNVPQATNEVMLVLRIQFDREFKTKRGVKRKQTKVVLGRSEKLPKSNKKALFDSAFKSCLAQATFSPTDFWVLDASFQWFEAIDKGINPKEFITHKHADEKGVDEEVKLEKGVFKK